MIYKGNTGIVMLLPEGDRVIKKPVPFYKECYRRDQCKALRREIAVYKHLPQGHPRLIRMLDYHDGDESRDGAEGHPENVSITLEYMSNHSLRSYLEGGARFTPSDEQLARAAAISKRQRAAWALEATDGIMLLHAHDIIHSDIRPENMLVDNDLHVRLIDFSGSSLKGARVLAFESSAFYMQRTPENSNGDVGSSVVTDLFALGSSIYQIMTGAQPYDDEPHGASEEHFKRGEFPPLVEASPDGNTPLLFADAIWGCWHGEFAAAADLLAALKAEIRAAFELEDRAFIEAQSEISGLV